MHRITLLKWLFRKQGQYLVNRECRAFPSAYPEGHNNVPLGSWDKLAQLLRQTVRMNGIYGAVHVVEAWVYVPKKPNDHTMKQILAGEMGVSDLKMGEKTEALIVRYECRDGSQRMWISPIVRPKAGGVALADALEMGETAEGLRRPVRRVHAFSSSARSSS